MSGRHAAASRAMATAAVAWRCQAREQRRGLVVPSDRGEGPQLVRGQFLESSAQRISSHSPTSKGDRARATPPFFPRTLTRRSARRKADANFAT